MSKVINICLVKHDVDLSGFQVVHEDGSAVRAENWQSLVRTELKSIITIKLDLLTSNLEESTLAIKGSSISRVPSPVGSNGDNEDTTESVVSQGQESGDEVRMPSRRTTFNQDQASQGWPQSPKVERTGSELEAISQNWALARRDSYKDDFEPLDSPTQVVDDTKDELPDSRKTAGFRHKQHLNSRDTVVATRSRKVQDQRATRLSTNTALIRASKSTDKRDIYMNAPSSRERRYPKKVSIEVVNDQDEEDDHDIYYNPRSLDPEKPFVAQVSNLPEKSEINTDDDRQPVQHQKLDSKQALRDELIQSIELSSIFLGKGQNDALVPPALSWKTGKPADLADVEIESHKRLPGKPRRC